MAFDDTFSPSLSNIFLPGPIKSTGFDELSVLPGRERPGCPSRARSPSVERQKTAVIVFPPLTMPTSPPLGAAMLKEFVEREVCPSGVKVLDLKPLDFRAALWRF